MSGFTEHTGSPYARRRGRRLLLAAVVVALPVAATALAVRSRAQTSTAPMADRHAIFRTTLLGEPNTRDHLRIRSVRVWSTRTLSGMWCRLAIGADVAVVNVERTPDLVFEVASEASGCRGWVAARHTSDAQSVTADR